jgi:hypothetical protein
LRGFLPAKSRTAICMLFIGNAPNYAALLKTRLNMAIS